MKRLLLICIIEICVSLLIDAGAQTIHCVNRPNDGEVTIYFKNPAYKIRDTVFPQIYNQAETFSWIKVNDEEFGIIDSVGMPCLPQITFDINLPENAIDITFRLVDSTLNIVHVNREIMPYQEDFCAEDTHTFFPFSINNTFYSSNDSFCPQRAVLSNPYRIRDKLGVSVTLFPYKYSPENSEINVLEELTLLIRYSLDGETEDSSVSTVFEDYYKSFFKNYIPSATSSAPPRYLIITPKIFSDDLEPFVKYKQSIGYEVEKIFIDSEDMSSEMVKSVIQARYDNIKYRPDYVLLVGDSVDLPPYQGDATGRDEDNPVTDLPYAQLDGDDLEVDVFIGRWPVSSNQELHNIIRKTVYMEMNTQQLAKRALFISGDDNSWWLIGDYMRYCFEVAHEYAIEETFEPEGYSCELRYQPYLNTVRDWMAWNPLIFAYSGHGSFTSMGRLYNKDYITDVFFSQCQNNTFPMVFSFACKTGNFAFYDSNRSRCIAESWIREELGGVTFLGSSVSTLTNSDIIIEKKIFGEAFFDANKRSIGKVIALGKRRYREYWSTTNSHAERFTKSYNLMGDPSLLVRGLACPSQFVINSDNIIVTDNKEYHAADRIVIGDGISLGTDSEMLLSAGIEVVFEDGFETTSNAEVEAWIENCSTRTRDMANVIPTGKSDGEKHLDETNDITISSFQLYPNPTSDDVIIEFSACDYGKAQMTICNLQGKIVYEKSIPITIVGKQSIPISLLNVVPYGEYVVTLLVDGQVYSKTIIIR